MKSSLGAPDCLEKSGREVVMATRCNTPSNIFKSTYPAAQDQLDSEVVMATSCSTQSNIDIFTSTNPAAPQDHRVGVYSKDLQIQQCDSTSPGMVCQIHHVTPYEAFKDGNPGGNQYCESSKDDLVSFQASARPSIDDVAIGEFASAPVATMNAHSILLRHENIHRRLAVEADSRLFDGSSGATVNMADRDLYTNFLRLVQSQDMHKDQPSEFINVMDYLPTSTPTSEHAANKSVLNCLDNADYSMKEQDSHLVLQSFTAAGWGINGSDSQMSLSSFKAVRMAQASNIIIDSKLQHEVTDVTDDCHNVTGVTIPEQPTVSGHDYLYNMNVFGARDAAAVYECKKSSLVNSDHQARDAAMRFESERVQRRLHQCQADELVQKSLTSDFANHVEASKSLAPELQTLKNDLEQSIKEQFQTFTDLMCSQIQSSSNLNVNLNANLKALQDISHQNLATTASWRHDFLQFSKTVQILMEQNRKVISSWMEYRDMKMETESQTQNSLDVLAAHLEQESEEIKDLLHLQIKEVSSLQDHNPCSTAFVEQLNSCLKYHLEHHVRDTKMETESQTQKSSDIDVLAALLESESEEIKHLLHLQIKEVSSLQDHNPCSTAFVEQLNSCLKYHLEHQVRYMQMEIESQTQKSSDVLAALLESQSEEIKHLLHLQIKEVSSLQDHNPCSTAFVEQLNSCLKYHLEHQVRYMKMEIESQTQNSVDVLAVFREESEEIKHLLRLQIKEMSSLQDHNPYSIAFVEQLNSCLKYSLEHHVEEILCKLSHERLEHNIKYENVQKQLSEELQQRSGCACKGPSVSSFLDGSATPNLLDCTFKSMVTAISALTTCFNSYLNARRDAPGPKNKIISEHFEDVCFARSGHVKLALKAHLYAHMFWGFESETFNLEEPIPCDPMQLSTWSFERFQQVNNSKTDQLRSLDSFFKQYCVRLFNAIMEDMDTSECAIDLLCDLLDVQDRQQCGYPRKKRVRRGSRPISAVEVSLCKSFLPAAQKVWALHKLCLSFEPRATIFRIQRGEMVDWNYMESVDQTATLVETAVPTVGFMIFPGLRLRNSIVKSEIYLGPPSGKQR